VKVKNGTDGEWARIVLYYGTSDHGISWGDGPEIMVPAKDAILNSDEEVTFDTGADCPLSLTWVNSSEGYNRCTLGSEFRHEFGLKSGWTHTCWNSSWMIKKHSDGLYHFDPN
jgi:hypothetical protein